MADENPTEPTEQTALAPLLGYASVVDRASIADGSSESATLVIATERDGSPVVVIKGGGVAYCAPLRMVPELIEALQFVHRQAESGAMADHPEYEPPVLVFKSRT